MRNTLVPATMNRQPRASKNSVGVAVLPVRVMLLISAWGTILLGQRVSAPPIAYSYVPGTPGVEQRAPLEKSDWSSCSI